MQCDKRRYNDELDAKIALLFARSNHEKKRKKKVESRYYRCPGCKGYHLTSKKK